VTRVWVGEEQVQLALPEFGGDSPQLLVDLLTQLGIVLGQLLELDDVARPPLELGPGCGQFAVLEGLARLVTRRCRIVPGPWPGEELV
jgi:hypothetical protein